MIDSSKPPGNELQLDLLIDQGKINERLTLIAKQLESDYEEKEITLIMIMKGSFFLVADLMRKLSLPLRIDFLQCSSYGEGGMNKSDLKIVGLETLDVTNKHLLIVDDIFDTGETLGKVIEELKTKKPASIKSLVLLTKNIPRQTDYLPDYSLFDIEDRFVIGYGLDYKEYYRGLPDIYTIH